MTTNQWINTPKASVQYVPTVQSEPNYYKPKSQHTIDYTVTVAQPAVVKKPKRISDFNFDNLFAYGIYLTSVFIFLF